MRTISIPRRLRSKRVLAVAAVGLLLVGGAVLGYWSSWFRQELHAGAVREYALEIVAKDIELGDGAVWHAWTYNGTVPGPTLRVKAGETLRVRMRNRHTLTHSFHARLAGFSFEHDGSAANLVTGIGAAGVLVPGNEHLYEYRPTVPGVYYYHTGFADREHSGVQPEAQGLYGAIVVQDPKERTLREEVLFMGEIGPHTEGAVDPFIMNGMGFPGGRKGLLAVFHREGNAGLRAQFNKTLPVFKAKVNESFKLHVINIGSHQHSLYIPSAAVTSLGVLGGRQWPARVVPLAPGAADTLLVKFTEPGLWLFRCHIPSHADQGMIGLFEVSDAAR